MQPSHRRLLARWQGARSLLVDGLTAEVVTALSAAGIRSVLLKGPVTARWLYPDDPGSRPYLDVDLLVAPDEHGAAEEVLVGLGFERHQEGVRLADEFEWHSYAWHRRLPGSAPGPHEPEACFAGCGVVDLHHTLHFLDDQPRQRVWEAVVAETEHWEVGGVRVEVLGPVARTLHVALHPSPQGPPQAKSWQDLRRALEVVDEATWRRAAALATSLQAAGAMGVGLRLIPEGVDLAERLGLPDRAPSSFLLQQAGAAPHVRSVARLGELPGLRRKARFVMQKLFPPPAFLRQWTPLASRSRLGLVAAYPLRLAWSLARLAPAVLAWARLRRAGPAPPPDDGRRSAPTTSR